MYQYEKVMEEEGLTLSELPQDARIGIETIAKIERVIKLSESKGKSVGKSVLAKIKANDKWAVREILDYVEGKDSKQNDEPPYSEEEIKKDVEKEEEVKLDPLGLSIDEEFKNAIEKGKNQLSIDELKQYCPKAYDVVFKNYEEDDDNGVETSHYILKEIETEKFILKTK